MLSDGLYNLLCGTDAITAIVGTPGPGGTRAAKTKGRDITTGIFSVLMPKEALLPAIVITEISGGGIISMSGANALRNARVQFSCYGKTPEEAIGLRVAIRRFLDGFLGALEDAEDNVGTVVQYAHVASEASGFEEAPGIYHAPIDFDFLYLDTGN